MSLYPLPQVTIPKHVPLMLAGQDLGLLDPTQPARILSDSHSHILFASYHPRAGASASPDNNTAGSITGPFSNRAVIEVLPGGHCLWRLIPLASGASSVEDEGTWPRLVDFCG